MTPLGPDDAGEDLDGTSPTRGAVATPAVRGVEDTDGERHAPAPAEVRPIPDASASAGRHPGEPGFTHTDPGTPEPEWLLAPQWDDVPSLDPAALFADRTRVVVASAHPDDETLGVGLLMQAAHRAGLPITVIVATDGEASHPHSRTWTPQLLSEVRRRELRQAVDLLAPGAEIVHLGLPDSGLGEHAAQLADRLTERLTPETLLLAPWTADGHIDHDTVGEAARMAAQRCGALLLHYPVWLWHWGTSADLPWDRAVTLAADPTTLRVKERALATHRSQVEPLGPLPGDEPVVGADVTTRAMRIVETYLVADAAVASRLAEAAHRQDPRPFDEMYDRGDDPWGFAESFYEERKRALLLAMLRRRRYASVLEVGCADGLLTADLAARADSVVAMDVSARAIEAASARGVRGAEFVVGAAPADLPDGPFDLVVLSEVGYFLSPTDWLATLRRCRAILAPEGELALVHWQHPTEDIPLDGPLVHAQARTLLDLPRTAHYADADVAADVYGGPGSIATAEGS